MEIIGHKIGFNTPVYVDENGQRYVRRDTVNMKPGQEFAIVLESATMEPAQGLSMFSKSVIQALKTESKSKVWNFEWPGYEAISRHRMVTRKNSIVEFCNQWADDKGLFTFGMPNAAMRIEDLPDGSRRYHCTDGTRDNDFTKFVFRLVPLEGESFEFTKTPHQPK